MSDTISFSFGENWSEYLKTVTPDMIDSAREDIVTWLGPDGVRGKTVIDIGSGSGIHSLAYYQLGAKELVSFDYDPKSVGATRSLWETMKRPANWTVTQGSILDLDFVQSLNKQGGFDIVYSWGVLHHTGAMWEAIENSCKLVKKGGLYWIALYVKGPKYQDDLALKRKYNQASKLGKKLMVAQRIIMHTRLKRKLRKSMEMLRQGKFEMENPFSWNHKKSRGMTVYHDIIDWLGGLPYEVASAEEVTDFLTQRNFELEKIQTFPERYNNEYLFKLNV